MLFCSDVLKVHQVKNMQKCLSQVKMFTFTNQLPLQWATTALFATKKCHPHPINLVHACHNATSSAPPNHHHLLHDFYLPILRFWVHLQHFHYNLNVFFHSFAQKLFGNLKLIFVKFYTNSMLKLWHVHMRAIFNEFRCH